MTSALGACIPGYNGEYVELTLPGAAPSATKPGALFAADPCGWFNPAGAGAACTRRHLPNGPATVATSCLYNALLAMIVQWLPLRLRGRC
ncbi:hypothetical protein N9L68_05265 [bacterium]|nr:hypothetical protein [bacterium]